MNTEPAAITMPGALNMETRVLQHDRSRVAVRLEGIYWQQLEGLARAGDRSLSTYVHSLLSQVPDKQNRASFLRCHCLQVLKSQTQHTGSFPKESNLGEIITACPSPVFVVSQDRRIVAFNPAFVSSVLETMKDENGDQPASPRLTFNQPFRKIVEYLAGNPNKVVSGQVGFMTDRSTLQRSVRFALLDRSLGELSPIVVFVETG